MCMIDGCEPWDFHTAPVHTKARTTKRCQECRREIHPGEYYYRGAGKADGTVYTIIDCAHCHVAVNWLAENCGGSVNEMVIEDIGEHAEENPEIGFGLMRVWHGARRKWQIKRGRHAGQLMPLPRMPLSIKEAMLRRDAHHAKGWPGPESMTDSALHNLGEKS
jgi:hypothetical protein